MAIGDRAYSGVLYPMLILFWSLATLSVELGNELIGLIALRMPAIKTSYTRDWCPNATHGNFSDTTCGARHTANRLSRKSAMRDER